MVYPQMKNLMTKVARIIHNLLFENLNLTYRIQKRRYSLLFLINEISMTLSMGHTYLLSTAQVKKLLRHP